MEVRVYCICVWNLHIQKKISSQYNLPLILINSQQHMALLFVHFSSELFIYWLIYGTKRRCCFSVRFMLLKWTFLDIQTHIRNNINALLPYAFWNFTLDAQCKKYWYLSHLPDPSWPDPSWFSGWPKSVKYIT